uniref:Rev protein n=1 Tax=Caprine arthritis encephalitis virus TaxID=11660 RepID=C9DI74_CAEV|nr:rev protein [Caprine arthritis encephalitis virus]
MDKKDGKRTRTEEPPLREVWRQVMSEYRSRYPELQATEELAVSDHRTGPKGEGYRMRGRRRRRGRGWFRWLRKLRARRFTEPDPDLEDPVPGMETLTLGDPGEGADTDGAAGDSDGAVAAGLWTAWRSPQK